MSFSRERGAWLIGMCAVRMSVEYLRAFLLHFGVLLRVHYGGEGYSKVGDWAPEVYRMVTRLVSFYSQHRKI